MRTLYLLLLCLPFFYTGNLQAQSKTEAVLVARIIASLQQKDSIMYAGIFMAADSMAMLTLKKAPSTSVAYERARLLLDNPIMLLNQDSLIDRQSYALFNALMTRGEKMKIHWHDCVLSRYELEALGKTRDEVMEAIVEERFVGYIFLEDILTRKQYGLMVSELMKMDGKWYGGELNHIFEAHNKDEFNAALKAEQIRLKKGLPDTLDTVTDSTELQSDDDDEPSLKRKQVSDRKLYTGLLDDEIPVQLYIRYIKGDCPEKICSWEALFRFGDQDEYTRPDVSRGENGKWIFTEEESGAVLEVELKGGVFTGIFTATSDKVDYDAKLQESPMSPKHLERLDAIIERGMIR